MHVRDGKIRVTATTKGGKTRHIITMPKYTEEEVMKRSDQEIGKIVRECFVKYEVVNLKFLEGS